MNNNKKDEESAAAAAAATALNKTGKCLQGVHTAADNEHDETLLAIPEANIRHFDAQRAHLGFYCSDGGEGGEQQQKVERTQQVLSILLDHL
jgi:hypothetical protein